MSNGNKSCREKLNREVGWGTTGRYERFNEVVREGLIEKLTFKKKPKRGSQR